MTVRKIMLILPESVAINQINEFIPYKMDTKDNSSVIFQNDFATDIVIKRHWDINNYTHSTSVYHGIHSVGQYYSPDNIIADISYRRGLITQDENDNNKSFRDNITIRTEIVERNAILERFPAISDYIGYNTLKVQIFPNMPDYSYDFALKIDVLSGLIGKSLVIENDDQNDQKYTPATLNKNAYHYPYQKSGIKFYNCELLEANFTKLKNRKYFKNQAEQDPSTIIVGAGLMENLNFSRYENMKNAEYRSIENIHSHPTITFVTNVLNSLETLNAITKIPTSTEYKVLYKVNPNYVPSLNQWAKNDSEKITNFILIFISSVICELTNGSFGGTSHYTSLVIQDQDQQFGKIINEITNIWKNTPSQYQLQLKRFITFYNLFSAFSDYIISNNNTINQNTSFNQNTFDQLKNDKIVKSVIAQTKEQIQIYLNHRTQTKASLFGILIGKFFGQINIGGPNSVNAWPPLLTQNIIEYLQKLSNDLFFTKDIINMLESQSGYLIKLADDVVSYLIFKKFIVESVHNFVDQMTGERKTEKRSCSLFDKEYIIPCIEKILIDSNNITIRSKIDEFINSIFRTIEVDNDLINQLITHYCNIIDQVIAEYINAGFYVNLKTIPLLDNDHYNAKTIITIDFIQNFFKSINDLSLNSFAKNNIYKDKIIELMQSEWDEMIRLSENIETDNYYFDNHFNKFATKLTKFLSLKHLGEDINIIREHPAEFFIHNIERFSNALFTTPMQFKNIFFEEIKKEIIKDFIEINTTSTKKYIHRNKILLGHETKNYLIEKLCSIDYNTNECTNNLINNLKPGNPNINNEFITFGKDYIKLAMYWIDIIGESIILLLNYRFVANIQSDEIIDELFDKIFVLRSSLPLNFVPGEDFTPNELGDIIQAEPVYGYMIFEINDDKSLPEDKQSSIHASAGLMQIKHFKDILNLLNNKFENIVINTNQSFTDDLEIN